MATPKHGSGNSKKKRQGRLLPAVAGALAIGVVAAGAVLVIRHNEANNSRTATRKSSNTRQPLTAVSSGRTPGSTGAASTSTSTTPIVPLTVKSITPAVNAGGVSTEASIRITFSSSPDATSATPSISPAVAGTWRKNGAVWSFEPTAGYLPATKFTVTVPNTLTTTEGTRTVHLTSAYTSQFTTDSGSQVRLQELLAELHYIPLNFFPRGATVSQQLTLPEGEGFSTDAATESTSSKSHSTGSVGGLSDEPSDPAMVSTAPATGRFVWAYPNVPSSLASDWSEGKANVITQGAVMAFEADHNLSVDGIAGTAVWQALREAVAKRQVDPRPYDYIMVNEASSGEALRIWEDGALLNMSGMTDNAYPINTGAAGAATALGTFPVFERWASHSMVGTNPNGTKYNDPDIPWISYFNGGDAIHGYVRYSYGFPQSNGCVEMEPSEAGIIWNANKDYYGTLVNVFPGYYSATNN